MQVICVCLLVRMEHDLVVKTKCWKQGVEFKGLRVNMGKTKVMCCNVGFGLIENSSKWP
jgi:hypothetical protein